MFVSAIKFKWFKYKWLNRYNYSGLLKLRGCLGIGNRAKAFAYFRQFCAENVQSSLWFPRNFVHLRTISSFTNYFDSYKLFRLLQTISAFANYFDIYQLFRHFPTISTFTNISTFTTITTFTTISIFTNYFDIC